MALKCSTKHESEMLANAMEGTLGDSYTVEKTKMRRPRVKIPGFNQEMSDDEIADSIKSQNQVKGDVKVVHIRKKGSGLKTVFCECTPDSFARLMSMRRVFIGWKRYSVYEDLDIQRCFQCQGYYHKRAACRNGVVCRKCSGQHETAGCTSQDKCCKNCTVANVKYGRSYDINHEAVDADCPVYRYHLQNLKNKIEYFSDL